MAIVPRWEWRSFGQSFGEAEARIRAVGAPGPVRESDEVYLLAAGCADNTKIRNGQMDIKRLRQVDDGGLQQWEPVFKESFPLTTGQLVEVFGVWGVDPPEPPPDSLSLDIFLQRWVPATQALRAVAVHKERHAYTVADAIVEIAELRIDGVATRTVAVEHADSALVARVVADLGLGALPNLSYLAGIRRLLGMG